MSVDRDSRLAKERLTMDGARYTWLGQYCVKVRFELGGDLSGGQFDAVLSFPEKYPFHPPTVRFDGPMWHVHVNERGKVVCDMLGACWSPVLSPTAVVLAVESLLNDPPDTQGLCCGRFMAYMYLKHNHSFRAVAHWFAQRYGGARVAPLPMVPDGEKTWLGYIAEAAPRLPSELCEAVLSFLFYRDPSFCVARAGGGMNSTATL